MGRSNYKGTRINAEVCRELSEIIRSKIHDPRIAPMTSVLEARVTKDLKYCTAFVSVLGSEKEQEKTIEGLNHAEGFIRSELAHTMNMRNTPEIRFILDKTMEYGAHVDEMIDKIHTEHDEGDTDEHPDGETK